MRILVVGDSYVPIEVFSEGLARLSGSHDLAFLQIDQSGSFEPASESEQRIHEFAGDPEQVVRALDRHEVLVVHGAPVTDECSRRRSCAWSAARGGGPVNVDMAAATERGIPVVTTPGKNAEAVAEQTIAFMVMLARRFPEAQRFLADGDRAGGSAFEGAEFFGHDLVGHTLGLVGFGHVGRRVAARARAFGMRILVYDPYLDAGEPDDVELGRLAPRPARRGRTSSRCTPVLTADRARTVRRGRFAAMKPGAYFVNTARETLVDERALADALASGHLGRRGARRRSTPRRRPARIRCCAIRTSSSPRTSAGPPTRRCPAARADGRRRGRPLRRPASRS